MRSIPDLGMLVRSDTYLFLLQITLSFDLFYRPPDQGEAGLDVDRFAHPLADLRQVRGADDLGEGDAEDTGADGFGWVPFVVLRRLL